MNNTIAEMRNLISCNNSFGIIQGAYEYLTEKYGKVVIAGGSMTDLIYGKDFYDIDVFIEYKDLKPACQKEVVGRTDKKIVAVFRDTYEGIDVDVVVLGISMADHVNNFDMNLKRISYDGSLHIHKAAAKDYKNKSISVNNLNTDNEWFRLYKASNKYGLAIDEVDEFIIVNYLSYLSEIEVSDKYKEYLQYFNPIEKVNTKLAILTSCLMCRNRLAKKGLQFVSLKRFKSSLRIRFSLRTRL